MPLTHHSYKTASDVVKTEGKNRYSRDEITLAAGSGDLRPGRVLAVAAGVHSPMAADGTADCILLENVKNSASTQTVVALRRHAEVVLQALEWPAGITATQQGTALAALETKGIVARNGV